MKVNPQFPAVWYQSPTFLRFAQIWPLLNWLWPICNILFRNSRRFYLTNSPGASKNSIMDVPDSLHVLWVFFQGVEIYIEAVQIWQLLTILFRQQKLRLISRKFRRLTKDVRRAELSPGSVTVYHPKYALRITRLTNIIHFLEQPSQVLTTPKK